MKKRYLTGAVKELPFVDGKICLVSGPRQCGKTTFAKMLLAERKAGEYRNWDETTFRRQWANDPGSVLPSPTSRKPILVLDEIHKDRYWKRNLKGIYDTLAKPCDIIVTGSARLNIYRKESDSLLGRHYHFRLHPFTLRELQRWVPPSPHDLLQNLLGRSNRSSRARESALRDLMVFGPFPEPLFSSSEKKTRVWRRNRQELVIREDLRDLSRLPDLSRIELLVALLPERVGSTIGINAISRHMEVSYDTAKRWLEYLKDLYYLHEIKPYHESIPRALKKEGKYYFWDFAEVDNAPARFENLIANNLLKACHLWTDTGEGSFELFYVRNKEKQEVDFLIVRNSKPWLPVEAKLAESDPAPHWSKFLNQMGLDLGIQVVMKPHWKVHEQRRRKVLVLGAAEFLQYLP